MSVDANALERETLERKDREELQKIVGALGGKATSRTRKADLIDQILELTGVTAGSSESTSADDDAEGGADKGSADKGSADKGGAKPASAKVDPPAPDQSKNDSAKNDGVKPQGGGNDNAKNDSAKNDDAKNDSAKNDSAKNDSAKNEGAKPQGGGNDSARSDGGQGDDDGDGNGKRRRRRGRNRDAAPQDEYTGEPIPVAGVLDLRDDGYGFLRVDGMLPSKDDCYVSVKQVRQFGLRKGDHLVGGSRPAFRNEKNPAIMRVDAVNDVALEPGVERPLFEELTPVFPTERLDLVVEGDDAITTRALDLLAPMGKGSRVLVQAAPRTGKTTLIETLVRAIEANEPAVALSVILVDERPEEITELTELVAAGEVHATSVDASADEHVASAELALARARRRAEAGEDVVVLLDGLTRLARAQHAAIQGTGRQLGGLDVAAIETAKRALGAGRALQGAGTLTVIATATADTTSAADVAVVDALVGVANVHVHLDAHAAARGVYPPIDPDGTGTRRADLLVGDDGAAARDALRRAITELPEGDVAEQAGALDRLLRRLRDTDSNEAVLAAVTES